MATPAFIGRTDWQIVSYTVETDPRTVKTTLSAVWHGPYPSILTQRNTMLPGTACPVSGYSNLKQRGFPRVNRNMGVYCTIAARYAGFIDGNSTVDTQNPLTSFRTEERSVTLDLGAVKCDVTYSAIVATTEWASDSGPRDNPRYPDRVNAKDADPELIAASAVKTDEADPDVSDFTEDVHYKIVTTSGFIDQSQDIDGIWTNREYSEKIVVPKTT
jgi:hypothetical protein